ncbi:uncharacterized protein LOC117182767 [Belonocnema kinseyi]|uniref:uncharacterized protein LOC117182767 n=1 Tax=Belonocnema kinseyi TaxID=2817044 RepID=UPI00143CFC35|nr:uncharacterized protein LOC117182767 [Belonocnema kinseyi]
MSSSAPSPVEIARENSVSTPRNRKASSESDDAGTLKKHINNCRILTTADGRRILEKDVFSPIVTAKEKDNIGLLLERMLMGQYLLNVQQKNLANKITLIGTHVQSLEENVGGEQNVKLVQDFAEDFDLNLPFAQLQDFQNFDNQLEADRTIRKRFKSTLSDLFTTDISVTLAQKNMIQKYISRSVIMQYTAQKKTDKKSLIFKNTEFYRAMLGTET